MDLRLSPRVAHKNPALQLETPVLLDIKPHFGRKEDISGLFFQDGRRLQRLIRRNIPVDPGPGLLILPQLFNQYNSKMT